MNYEELMEKWANNEEVSDDEFNFLLDEIYIKIQQHKELDEYELGVLDEMECFSYSQKQLLDTECHGWVKYLYPILVGDDWYGAKVFYHDDRGSEYETQTLERIEKREVKVERWEYI